MPKIRLPGQVGTRSQIFWPILTKNLDFLGKNKSHINSAIHPENWNKFLKAVTQIGELRAQMGQLEAQIGQLEAQMGQLEAQMGQFGAQNGQLES